MYAVNELVAAWIDPAVHALERRALSSLALVADGSGGAYTWQAHPPSWWERLRARLGAPAFVPPDAVAFPPTAPAAPSPKGAPALGRPGGG
jgi:hypothetical protein